MIRTIIACAVLSATPALAQSPAEPTQPEFDAEYVNVCLENASLREQQGEAADYESCIGVAAEQCVESAASYSNVGMSDCYSQELKHWDFLLNEAYGALMVEAKAADDELEKFGSAAPKQAPPLQDMQREWIGYRDAACSYERSRWGGGSGSGPAAVQCSMALTARQYLWLRAYLAKGE